MKVFNNPHFSAQLTPSQSLVHSRAKTLIVSGHGHGERLTKSQTVQDIMVFDQSQNENNNRANGFQEEVIESPDINQLQTDDFIEKLQRLSEKQMRNFDEKQQCAMLQSPESQNSQAHEKLVASMTNLHDQVLDLLHQYQQNLGRKGLQQDEARRIKTKIKQDTFRIQALYSDVIQQFNKSLILTDLGIERLIPSQEEEKEINQLFNLVEEFLEKFGGQKALMNAYTILLKEKVESSEMGTDLIAENDSERSSMYDFEYNPYDSSTDISNSEIQEQLLMLKQELQDRLLLEKLETSQNLLNTTVTYLQDVEYFQETRIIDERINYLKESLQGQEESLKSSLEKALVIMKSKKDEIELTLSHSSNLKKQKGLRRRRFFDIALKQKKMLSSNSQAKRLLVSELYESSLEESIQEEQWEKWIKVQFENLKQCDNL